MAPIFTANVGKWSIHSAFVSEKTENLDPIQISISEKEYTPRKTDMEPENGHLEETYFQGFMLVLQGHILGNVPTKKKTPTTPPKTEIFAEKWWLEDDISFWDGLFSADISLFMGLSHSTRLIG